MSVMCDRTQEVKDRDRDELLRFKRDVDLVKLAESFGYSIRNDKSTKKIHRMMNGGVEVSVKKGQNEQWMFYDLGTKVSGSVIDFVQRESGCTLVEVRHVLRRFMGTGNPKDSFPTSPSVSPPAGVPVATVETDRKKCVKVWESATWNPDHAYLRTRGLNHSMHDPRFLNTFREDRRGNAVLPHYDRLGMCGYEYRNTNFKGMGKDTIKGLWYSNNLSIANEIFIVESPINALSHFELYQTDIAYCSFGGGLSSYQVDLIKGLLFKAKQRRVNIIVGTDNDAKGESYYEKLQSLSSFPIERATPVGNDWNEDLLFVLNEA